MSGILRSLWVFFPALAGAIVGLSAAPRLSLLGKVASVFNGALSAIFIAPMLIDMAKVGWTELPSSVENFIIFTTGATAMGGIPLFLKWGYSIWGDPLGLLAKVRAGAQKPEPTE